MIFCIDCIHYNICDYSPIIAKNQEKCASKCRHFLDKNLCLKLPCKIGDSYYRIQQQCTQRGYYDNFVDTDIMDCESYCDRDGECDRRYYIKEYQFTTLSQIVAYYEHNILDTDSQKYRVLFHDRADAERALEKKEVLNENKK